MLKMKYYLTQRRKCSVVRNIDVGTAATSAATTTSSTRVATSATTRVAASASSSTVTTTATAAFTFVATVAVASTAVTTTVASVVVAVVRLSRGDLEVQVERLLDLHFLFATFAKLRVDFEHIEMILLVFEFLWRRHRGKSRSVNRSRRPSLGEGRHGFLLLLLESHSLFQGDFVGRSFHFLLRGRLVANIVHFGIEFVASFAPVPFTGAAFVVGGLAVVGAVVLTRSVLLLVALLALGTVLLFLRAAGDFLMRSRFRFLCCSCNE